MYELKEIRKETMNWNEEDNTKTKTVRSIIYMENVEEEIAAVIEKMYNEFFEEIKKLVPDTTPAQAGTKLGYSN